NRPIARILGCRFIPLDQQLPQLVFLEERHGGDPGVWIRGHALQQGPIVGCETGDRRWCEEVALVLDGHPQGPIDPVVDECGDVEWCGEGAEGETRTR